MSPFVRVCTSPDFKNCFENEKLGPAQTALYVLKSGGGGLCWGFTGREMRQTESRLDHPARFEIGSMVAFCGKYV